MNKLYCIRHGKTAWNIEQKMQGSKDIPLNDEGIEDAKRAKTKIDLDSIDICLCSPMIRTRQTAEILVGDKLPIIYDSVLVERSFGDYEGKKYDPSLQARHWDYNLNDKTHGIEPLHDLIERVENFLEYIDDTFQDKNILIISHGCFIKTLHYCVNGYTKDTDFDDFFPDNGVLYEYELKHKTLK